LKNQVPQEVLDAAKQLGKDALERKLKEIEMNTAEADLFIGLSASIRPQVQILRVILEGINAKQKERFWLKNQNDGELDDTKLVEGITGEHAIYKKRGKELSDTGLHELPKRIKFVVDVSGSMYRFNSYDQRLSKMLETSLLVMESLQGLEQKYLYDIVGHSGDTECINFVEPGKPPKNEKEMLKVLQRMWAHAQYCWSGDNTLPATSNAIKEIANESADDYFVIVISDANLNRYGISANILSRIIEQDPKVSVTMLFIGSLGDEAQQLINALPRGKSFVVKNTAHIPTYMKEIFSAVASK
jgi:von Willebrand factor A domain-containing protein 8